MIGEWTNHLWQSTLFAVVAGLLTIAFRRNRAEVRYWMWLSASFKFLIPFWLLMSLGSHLEWAPAARKIAAPAVSLTIIQISQPFPGPFPPAPSTRGTRDWVLVAILSGWACGFAAVTLIRFRGWRRIRSAVLASAPIDIPAPIEVRSAPGLLEPGVVGLWRPILLLPAGIMERLTPCQLEAVLAHEWRHVQRRDNLTSAIHMIVEAVFWFHPLVWWIGARLMEERERACDEEVLRLGSEPQVYAEAILNVCKLYVQSPLRNVSGVTGSNLKKRIQAILTGRVAGELNFAKKVALAVAGVAALAAPIVVGMMNAPLIRAQSAAAATPKFEAASIAPCPAGTEPPAEGTDRGRQKNSAGLRKKGPGPSGRLDLSCLALAGDESLIHQAYVIFANGHFNPPLSGPTIVGGPAWIHSEPYSIHATAEGNPSPAMMRGPMLQALLEDRFKLKIHRESREAPVYALTVANSRSKLREFKEGTCRALNVANRPPQPPPQGGKYCNFLVTLKGPNVMVYAQGATLDEFSRQLGLALDLPVIDKTGIPGRFDLDLEFAIDQTTPRFLSYRNQAAREDGSSGASIFTALQQELGLKLEPTTGPREFLVVDRVERPSGN